MIAHDADVTGRRKTALSMARDIRERRTTAVEVVTDAIWRARSINSKVNALVVDRFDEAVREARNIDAALDRGELLGPLAGVPCTVKESLGFAGLPHTIGSTLRRGIIAERSATTVARLRAAGAIVIGLTNVSEMTIWPESDNLVYGRTNHPLDPTRTVGGSSGGEAALVAAGVIPFGVGTDGGGSIRIPSAYCGVYGLKPSAGVTPLTGHPPLHDGQLDMESAARFFAAGPICARPEDLMPVLKVLAGPDGFDDSVRPICLGNPEDVSFVGKRVLVCAAPKIWGATRVDESVQTAVRQVGRFFCSLGARVETWDHPLLRHSALLWLGAIRDEGRFSIGRLVGEQGLASPFLEALARLRGRPKHHASVLLCLLGEVLSSPLGPSLDKFAQCRFRLLEDFEKAVGMDGVLVCPAVPTVAPKHGRALFRPFDFAYAGVFNALQIPVVAAPFSTSPDGFPIGIQIAAARGRDHVAIAAALALENRL